MGSWLNSRFLSRHGNVGCWPSAAKGQTSTGGGAGPHPGGRLSQNDYKDYWWLVEAALQNPPEKVDLTRWSQLSASHKSSNMSWTLRFHTTICLRHGTVLGCLPKGLASRANASLPKEELARHALISANGCGRGLMAKTCMHTLMHQKLPTVPLSWAAAGGGHVAHENAVRKHARGALNNTFATTQPEQKPLHHTQNP